MKGTVEHGTLLGTVDEIVMTLDDNSMNLQSMSASRYVGPFLEKVQKWEKSLSHISEVVEVSVYIHTSSIYILITRGMPTSFVVNVLSTSASQSLPKSERSLMSAHDETVQCMWIDKNLRCLLFLRRKL